MARVLISKETDEICHSFIDGILKNVESVCPAKLDSFHRLMLKNIQDPETYNGFLGGIRKHRVNYYFNDGSDSLFDLKKEVLGVFHQELINFGNYKF